MSQPCLGTGTTKTLSKKLPINNNKINKEKNRKLSYGN